MYQLHCVVTGLKMIVLPTTAVLVLVLLIPRLNAECCPSTGRAVIGNNLRTNTTFHTY